MVKPKVSYVVAGGFPGGTSSAIAAELRAIQSVARPSVAVFDCDLFRTGTFAPQLEEVIRRERLHVAFNPRVVQDDVVILHNPSFLKRNSSFDLQITARHLIVVTHENFLRPGGFQPYDVATTLSLIDSGSVALKKTLAPIGPFNRSGVESWLGSSNGFEHWSCLSDDWFNIFDMQPRPPTQHPRDRRGRVSRSGAEKFPHIAELDLLFPPQAEANVILGGDHLERFALSRPHWTIHPFRSRPVEDVLSEIDFFVYFAAPTWRESFGRVIAEAIEAGKLVITDPETAKPFGKGVVGTAPEEVSSCIASFIAAPDKYVEHVVQAQSDLERYSPEAFRDRFQWIFQLPKLAA